MTHYETLGIPRDASPEDIKKAFRKAASAAHPDREGGSAERMTAINRAYACLSDPAKRAKYDRGEGDAPDNTQTPETLAELNLFSLFDNLITTFEGNIIQECHRVLSDKIKENDRQLAKLKRMQDKAASWLKYCKSTDTDDLLARACQAKTQSLADAHNKLTDEQAVIKLMKTRLKLYSCDVSGMPVTVNPYQGRSSGSSLEELMNSMMGSSTYRRY